MVTHAQREKMAEIMDFLVLHRNKIHYRELRPMRTRTIRSFAELRHAVAESNGITMDCSESVTLVCKLAGLEDPNGFRYDGAGYTGTLLDRLPHYHHAGGASIGALVVFGPGTGEHVCMVRRPGTDPLLFSHGQESDPRYIPLAIEARIHRPPTTFLNISHL